jgi:thymidine kinase
LITYIYSTVNAGKTANLLMRVHSCSERGHTFALFVPAIASSRDGDSQIVSRVGFKREATKLESHDCPYEHIASLDTKPSVVFVDEAQFLTKEQVKGLTYLSDRLNIPVYAYGLRTDFKGEPFVGSLYLLSWADYIEEVSTFAVGSACKATFNMKVDAEGNQMKEGDSVSPGFGYKPVSRKEFGL